MAILLTKKLQYMYPSYSSITTKGCPWVLNCDNCTACDNCDNCTVSR